MRAAPGFAPRAIARLSRRIDIAETLFDGVPKVAGNDELRVNPGAVGHSCNGSVRSGQVARPRFPSVRRCGPPEGSRLLTYFEAIERTPIGPHVSAAPCADVCLTISQPAAPCALHRG